MSPERKISSSPETAALEKMQQLADLLKEQRSVGIKTPEKVLQIYLYYNDLIVLSLSEAINVIKNLYTTTLVCHFALVNPSLSSITIYTRDNEKDNRKLTVVLYGAEGNRHISSSLFIQDLAVTPQGKWFIQDLPSIDKMPEQIDFPSVVGKICDIAFASIKDGYLPPERISRLKEAVYGQAAKEPAGQK